jgi:hypothetical protein
MAFIFAKHEVKYKLISAMKRWKKKPILYVFQISVRVFLKINNLKHYNKFKIDYGN